MIERIGGRTAFENERVRVRVDDIRYADGTLGTYTIVERPDFALAMAYENGGFWLVRQFRYASGLDMWEFPMGAWPAGHSGTPLELAVAELHEEAGVTATNWQHLGRLFTAIGFSAQAYDIFLATGLTAGEPRREATEQDMHHEWFPLARIKAMVAAGEITDAHSIAALALFDLRDATG